MLSLVAIAALACGGEQHTADTSTAPHEQLPTMNDTGGPAPGQVPPAVAASGTFDMHDNSGFAGLKTDSMSPAAQATRSQGAQATATTSASDAQTTTPPRGQATAAPANATH